MRKAIEEKKKLVEHLVEKAKGYDVITLITLRNLPDFIFQATRKELKKKGAYVKVAKLAVLKRVLKQRGLEEWSEKLNMPACIILGNIAPYDMAVFFRENRKKVPAKPGQVAPFDIVVPAGETPLPPGPALTELKQAGLPVQIKGGKIAITKDHVLVKEGEEVDEIKAKVLQKLDILPFDAGVEIIMSYDGKYIYTPDVLSITPQEILDGVMNAFAQGMNVSINAGYPTPATAEAIMLSAITQARNVGINGQLYSPETINEVLSVAVRQGVAVGNKTE